MPSLNYLPGADVYRRMQTIISSPDLTVRYKQHTGTHTQTCVPTHSHYMYDGHTPTWESGIDSPRQVDHEERRPTSRSYLTTAFGGEVRDLLEITFKDLNFTIASEAGSTHIGLYDWPSSGPRVAHGTHVHQDLDWIYVLFISMGLSGAVSGLCGFSQ